MAAAAQVAAVPSRLALELALAAAMVVVVVVATEQVPSPPPPPPSSAAVEELPLCSSFSHELGSSVVPKYAQAASPRQFDTLLQLERMKLAR